MTLCKECGAINKEIVTIHEGGDEYIACPDCKSENSVKEIDEKEYYEDMETERRISIWKEER